MKIRLIGDVHGKFSRYFNKALPKPRHGMDCSLALGDFGWGWSEQDRPKIPDNAYFIYGNHDSPAAHEHPQCIGDWGMWNGLWFVSGAWSIDRQHRTEGVSWWPIEETPYMGLREMVSKYEETKPDIVVSHDAPESVVKELVGHHYPNRTSAALEACYTIHVPKLWVFGHHHRSWKQQIGRCLFVCLDELETFDVEV